MGYSFRHLRPVERLVYGLVGVFLLMPVEVSDLAMWLNVVGVCVALALLAWERAIWKRTGGSPREVMQPVAVGEIAAPGANKPAQTLPPFSSLD
jgi:hypothetical protein